MLSVKDQVLAKQQVKKPARELCTDFAILLSGGFGGRAGQTAGLLGSKDVLDLEDGESIIVMRVQEILEAGFKQVVLVARKGRAIQRYHEIFEEIDREYLDYLENSDSEYKKNLAERLREIQSYPVEIVEQNPNLPYGNFSPLYTLYRMGKLKSGYSYLVSYADDDVMGENPSERLRQAYLQGQADVVMMAQKVPEEEVSKFGTFDFVPEALEYGNVDGNNCFLQGMVRQLAEKRPIGQAPSDIASLGRMILPYDIFEYALNSGYDPDGPKSAKEEGFSEFNTVDAINAMADDGYRVMALGIVKGLWLTTGDVQSLNFARFARDVDKHPESCVRDVRYLLSNPKTRQIVMEEVARAMPSR